MSRPTDQDYLRMTFDEVADLYDAIRPTYPAELVEAICSILPGTEGRILEIGGGTGQATMPFARKGYRVTALEPGRKLAALAAKNLGQFPSVEIQTTTFEDWPVRTGQYDLVMSATAFHWVSPEVRYTKTAQALSDKGWLALFWNSEAPDESVLGQQIQAVYNKHMPTDPSHPYTTHHPNTTHHPMGQNNQQNPHRSRWEEEITASPLFGKVRAMQFRWTQWYTTEEYLRLLETYSDHRTLPLEKKRDLFDSIAEILARQGGGRNKPYLTNLYLAPVQKENS